MKGNLDFLSFIASGPSYGLGSEGLVLVRKKFLGGRVQANPRSLVT